MVHNFINYNFAYLFIDTLYLRTPATFLRTPTRKMIEFGIKSKNETDKQNKLNTPALTVKPGL